MVIGADYQQVALIGGGTIGQGLCEIIKTIELTVVHRTDDPEPLAFLLWLVRNSPLQMKFGSFSVAAY